MSLTSHCQSVRPSVRPSIWLCCVCLLLLSVPTCDLVLNLPSLSHSLSRLNLLTYLLTPQHQRHADLDVDGAQRAGLLAVQVSAAGRVAHLVHQHRAHRQGPGNPRRHRLLLGSVGPRPRASPPGPSRALRVGAAPGRLDAHLAARQAPRTGGESVSQSVSQAGRQAGSYSTVHFLRSRLLQPLVDRSID